MTTPQPIRCSVAAVIRRAPDDAEFLVVRRPHDDESLPGEWGFPAVTLQPGELPENGLRRIGDEKLGIDIQPTRLIGVDTADRGSYRLILMDIEATIISGEPDPAAAITAATRYTEARWTTSLDTLRSAAEKGSLCCAIMLREGRGS